MWIWREVKTTGRLAHESGLALIEVSLSSLIVGIIVIGLALMGSWSQALVIGEGDSQVALFLAEQKLEKLRIWGFDGARVLASTDGGATAGCPDDEPCYLQTINAGVGNTPGQRFTRRTCVDYVDNPPYPAACTPNAGSPTKTKRIQVRVIPDMPQADPITLDMVLVSPP